MGTIHRVFCEDCQVVRQEEFGIADPKKRYTRRLARYALDLASKLSIADVAKMTGLGWDVVKSILKADLAKRSRKIKLRTVRYLAIDEISQKKGQNYLTVVLDLESGQPLHVGDGRGKDAVAGFFKRLRRSGAKLKAVAMDMHDPFLLALRENYSADCPVVFDRFHVMQLMNGHLDEVRRSEVRAAEEKGDKRYIKNTRYLLLKGEENLDDKGRARLDRLLQINENLSTAYILKEELRAFWEEPHRRAGKKALRAWLQKAEESGLPPLRKMAATIRNRMEGLLAYFSHPITTGPLEGLNNVIKLLKRKAFGYRDSEFFKLRILFIHECNFGLSGS